MFSGEKIKNHFLEKQNIFRIASIESSSYGSV